MVRKETDTDLINSIANGPGVGEYIRPDGKPMDFSEAVEAGPVRSGVVFLSNGQDAVGAFEITADGVYQTHAMFAQTCRGKRAIETGREMIDWMFARGAEILWCDVPRWNRHTLWFARQLGYRPLDTSDEDTEVLEVRKVH